MAARRSGTLTRLVWVDPCASERHRRITSCNVAPVTRTLRQFMFARPLPGTAQNATQNYISTPGLEQDWVDYLIRNTLLPGHALIDFSPPPRAITHWRFVANSILGFLPGINHEAFNAGCEIPTNSPGYLRDLLNARSLSLQNLTHCKFPGNPPSRESKCDNTPHRNRQLLHEPRLTPIIVQTTFWDRAEDHRPISKNMNPDHATISGRYMLPATFLKRSRSGGIRGLQTMGCGKH